MNNYLLYSILGINLWVFLLMMIDKIKGIRRAWRIKESTLLIFGFFGGSIGLLMGMLILRHKIRKIKFFLLALLSTMFHLILIYSCI